ncbi:MAG: pirin family protein, partial [Bacteroidia bacterium]|nr:pirin family protein [Bacteroidia bacterium]
MSTKVIHKSETRGKADHGWLKARHTFSFSDYSDPSRVNFGMLRVLNDDQVAGGMGFGKHPHENMEIITIPLSGSLVHSDSMGNTAVIESGDVQVMSAGTGIFHSEKNNNIAEPLKLLQIWVFPDKNNVEPRYGQMTLKPENSINKLEQIVSPDESDSGMWIHQSAWFYIGSLDAGVELKYHLKKKGNGVYAFIISGASEVDGEMLNDR